MDLLTQSIGIPTGLAGWNMLQTKSATDFKAFTNDPVLKREIAYFEQAAPTKTTAKDLLADPRLQEFVLTAFGLGSQIGSNALMQKVLNSNLSDKTSLANMLTDYRYRSITQTLGFGTAATPATPAVASKLDVLLDQMTGSNDFASFSGTFGGVTLQDLDLSGATSRQAIASRLTQAFQRADGNRTDIQVKVVGLQLQFTDAKGRGDARAFTWEADASDAVTPTAGSPTGVVAGSVAVAASGGSNLTSPGTVGAIVQKYTEARFEEVVGNTSNTLRTALYAKSLLPQVTNWYSVIADTNLAPVVETALGLDPTSFAKLDVDRQNQILTSKMKISDLQDPAKLDKLLDRYVAIGSASETQSSGTASPAVQLLAAFTGSSSSYSYSSASAAALLLST